MKKLLSMFLLINLFSVLYSQEIKNGILKIDDPKIFEKKIISLDGNWEYISNSNFSFEEENTEKQYQTIPQNILKKFFQIIGKNRDDTSTYKVKITGLTPNGKYAIFSRRCPSTAANIYCNNELIETYGHCSTVEKNHRPSERPIYLFLYADGKGDIDLRIDVSSFANHATGITVAILFSEERLITNYFRWMTTLKSFLIGIMLFCCIINFSIYLNDKNAKQGNINGIIFIALIMYVLTKNGNLLGALFNNFSYTITIWMQSLILWVIPLVFSLILQRDENFTKRNPYIDNFFVVLFVTFGLIFSIFPVRYTNYIFFTLTVINFVFYFYMIVRFSYALVYKQNNIIPNIISYMIIETGVFLDIIFSDYSTKQVVLFAEFFLLILVIFDVIYMAYSHQYNFQQISKVSKNLKIQMKSYNRFFSNDFVNLFEKKPLNMHISDSVKINATMMIVQFESISPNGRIIVPREKYESIKNVISAIYKIIISNGGIISNLFEDGFISIFNKSPEDSLICAKVFLDEIKKYNLQASKMNELCVMCSVAIHTDDFTSIVVGEQSYINTTFFGKGFNIIRKILSSSATLGIPCLVSQATINKVDSSKIKVGNSVESAFVQMDEDVLKVYEYGLN